MRIFKILIAVTLMSLGLSGCFFKSKGSNPIGPVLPPENINVISETAETGDANLKIQIAFPNDYYSQKALDETIAKSGSATVSFVLANNKIRASAAYPQIMASLFVNDLLHSKKSFAVNGSSAEISFTNLPNTGSARVDLELFSCNIRGFTKFSGSGDLGANASISVLPIVPDGALVTADYHMLREIGVKPITYFEGPMHNPKLSFNELGQPLGVTTDGYITNMITNQKFFKMYQPIQISEDRIWSPQHFAYLNGEFIVAGSELIYKVSLDGSVYTPWIGKPNEFRPPTDGIKITDATVPVVFGIVSQNGSVYFNSNLDTLVKVSGDILEVYGGSFWGSPISVDEFNNIYLPGTLVENEMWGVAKMTSKSTYEFIGPPQKYQQTSIVTYENGYLIGGKTIMQVMPDGTYRDWLVFVNGIRGVALYVYKNSQGKIFVTEYYSGKIWEVL